VIGNMSIKEN